MQDDPLRYWRELTDNYRQMSDGELLDLAAAPDKLTDVARQVLRDEMRLRELNPTNSQHEVRSTVHTSAAIHWELPPSYGSAPHSAPPDENDGPLEYTWKTQLCDCETSLQAWQVAETLRRAGIDSWIQAPPDVSRYDAPLDLTYPRVLVAADQLELAQRILAQPISQDVIEESRAVFESTPAEFEMPACPKCGSKNEVVLESANPVNSWLCEACGAEWADAEKSASGTDES